MTERWEPAAKIPPGNGARHPQSHFLTEDTIMIRLDLLCSFAFVVGLPACSDSTTGSSANKEIRYAGTVSQPAPGGFLVYRISGVWKFDNSGAFLSGVDTVKILDASVYGISGTGTMVSKTRCASFVGKEAWSESEVVESTNPQLAPVGGIGITHLVISNGAPMGGGGPRDFWYPTGNICADKPANVNSFAMKDGSITIP